MNRLALIVALAGFAAAAVAQDKPASVPMTLIGQPGTAARPAAKPANKPDLYDEAADAKQQIAAALVKTKKENRRVLIQWGFNTCSWCQLMHREFAKGELARKLMYEYDVVYVESAKNKANAAVAKTYAPDLNGYPYLTVLDSSGKVLANQETDSLEVKDEHGQSLLGDAMAHDEKKMLAFLTAHQAPYLQADAVVKDGLDQAKSSGRKVFLHFGAPWCGWCHRLEDWMAQDDIARTFAKDFVGVKVDQDRMIGAKEVEAAYKMPADSGIPWFVIIDPADGKVLSTSTGDKGNIGYPGEPEEIEQFMKMLDGAHKNLTAADLESMRASLTDAGKKLHH